ncbi:MAG: hypothetical protein K2K10_00210 [Acetatifactor sp.]|nr:hypothetical protein [Acetatifactor sp.]
MDNKSQKRIAFKDIPTGVYGLCIGILLVFALFIGLFLTYYSVRYSYYSSTDYTPIYLVKDNVVFNLLLFLGICLLTLLLNFLFHKLGDKQRLAGYLFLGLCCILYVTVCLIWVTELPYYPSGDQLNATAAAHYNLDGNFIMFKKSGYIGKFPYQKGLTFLYEILFTLFGDFCYPVAAKMHIFLGVITMIFGYLFVEETSWNSICKILYCPLVLFCTPYLILTPYTYGDLPSICFCIVLFWALLRYVRTERIRYVTLACVMAVLSLMVRLHTWIVLIAVLIGMVLAAWQKKKLQPLLAGLLIIASSFSAIKALDYSYALRSGYEITQGAPMILTLAMGLQDNDGGPGTYNNYQTLTMDEAAWDNETAKEIARENIQENLEHFKADPAYAKWFFKTKILRQWIEPSFETLMSTRSFDEKKTMPDWIEQIYYGNLHDPLMRFANGYQSVVYLGFLFFLPVLWKRRRENAAGYIPLIAIVGGFLFSIIWESQCRYVLPYYLFMLVYVPDGIHCVGDWARKGLKRFVHIHQSN